MIESTIYAFNTSSIRNPWSQSDVDYYKRNGSQRDRIIYNAKLNARFQLDKEPSTDRYVYSCNIKLANGNYRNFLVFPITFNCFFFYIYVPEISLVINSEKTIRDKILKNFPLLEKCVKSADSVVSLDEDCNVCGDTLLLKVNAPINQLLFPRYDNISNYAILEAYDKLCCIYDTIRQQADGFESCFSAVCDQIQAKIMLQKQRLEEQKQRLEEQQQEIKDKLKRIVIRKVVLGVATAGVALALDAVSDLTDMADMIDTFSTAEGLAELANWNDITDILDSLDIDYTVSSMGIDAWDIADVSDIDIDAVPCEYHDLEQSYNVSFGANKESLEKNINFLENQLEKEEYKRDVALNQLGRPSVQKSEYSTTFYKNQYNSATKEISELTSKIAKATKELDKLS